MKAVSVVILNWNGASMLRRFLPSVIEHSPEAEIIVADNGSTDDSVQVVEQEFPAVGIIRLDQNYGFAEGYNRAIAQVSTPYTLLLNSDVEVTAGWLHPLLSFMEAHPDAAACQPKLLNLNHRESFEYAGACGGFLDSLGYPYCRGRVMSVVEQDRGQYDGEPVPVFWATGAAMLIRTDIYNKVGGLDSRFFAHQEEIDLCWRLRSRGYGVWSVTESKVYHLGGATLDKSNPRKTFLNFRNNLLMLYKNLPASRKTSVLATRYFLDYLAALQMLLGGRRKEALAVVRARFEYSHIRHEFDEQRRQNLAAATVDPIPEQRPKSLLWNFYIKRRRTFSDLK
ncbi:MAG: glycosyltransferase family 2 protein [Bacteroidaceae bacterium]|nr:glycosyltransferase family 2 protein [Bacteroidaceae bacterium]